MALTMVTGRTTVVSTTTLLRSIHARQHTVLRPPALASYLVFSANMRAHLITQGLHGYYAVP